MQRFLAIIGLVCLTGGLYAQSDSIAMQSINEIVILSAATSLPVKTTVPVQSINSETIYRIGIQSVSDAVRRFSGVTVKDYGGVGGMKTVSLRGMGAQHTAISYDGVTISNTQSGIVDIGFFSLDNISQISLSAGQPDNIFQTARAYASAGVLSIETATPNFTSKPYKGNVAIKTGSFGYFNPGAYYAHKINDKFSASANVNWERTDGRYPYEMLDVRTSLSGKRTNSDVSILRTELNLYGNLDRDRQLKVKMNYFDSEKGVPGQVIAGKVYYPNDRLQNKDFFVQAQYKHKLNKQFSTQTNAKFSKLYYNFFEEQYGNRDKVTQSEYYASAGLLYTPLKYVSVSLTEDIICNVLNDNFKNSRDPKRLSSLTLFASQFKNDYLTITGSLLSTYMTEEVKTGNGIGDRKKITPFIGFSYRPLEKTDLRFRTFYKKIFRVPTFAELYYTRYENYTLKPEYTTQYNAGFTWMGRVSSVFDFIRISVDGYNNKIDNKIVATNVGASIPQMRNFGKVKATGLDINTRFEKNVTKDISLNLWGTYGYQKVINVTDKTDSKTYKHQLPHTPKHFGSFALSCDNPWLNVSYTAIVSGMRYWSSQNKPENELESYSDHTVSVNKTLFLNDKILRLQLNLLNIGDESYQIIRYYPMPRRSFTLSANLSF